MLRKLSAAGDVAGLRLLLQQHPDVLNAASHDTGDTALIQAARFGREACLATLVAAGADVNAENPISGMTALHLAVAVQHQACVEALLAAGADVGSAIHAAARLGDLRCLRALLAAGADARGAYGSTTPLHSCCMPKEPSLACVQLLLAAGPTCLTDWARQTALHKVSHSLDTLHLLLAAGANPNAAGEPSAANRVSLAPSLR